MIRSTLLALSLLAATPVLAQDNIETSRGAGAVRRTLDTVSSEIADVERAPGESAASGRLPVRARTNSVASRIWPMILPTVTAGARS